MFNTLRLIQLHGEAKLGFATLTFAGASAPTPKRAHAAFARFRRAFLDPLRPNWIAVLERGSKGRLHFHCIAALKFDAQKGAQWSDGPRPHIKNPSPTLRAEWLLWRHAARKNGFGAVHGPLPIRRSARAVSEYLAGYVAKSLGQRRPGDRSVKLVLYGRTTRAATVRTSAVSEVATLRREKVGFHTREVFGPAGTTLDWYELLGPRWSTIIDTLPQGSDCDAKGEGRLATQTSDNILSYSVLL